MQAKSDPVAIVTPTPAATAALAPAPPAPVAVPAPPSLLARWAYYVRPEDGGYRAAVVVDGGDGTGQNAHLLVFGTPRESMMYTIAAFDADTKAPGTWHWAAPS